MSLINDALKRAQQERDRQKGTPGAAGSPPAPAPQQPVYASPPPKPMAGQPGGVNFLKVFVGLIIAGSALASAVAFMIFLWVQTDSKPQPQTDKPLEVSVSLQPEGNADQGLPAEGRPKPDTGSQTPDTVSLSNDAALVRQLDSAPTVAASLTELTPQDVNTPRVEANQLAANPPGSTEQPSTINHSPSTTAAVTEISGTDPGLIGSPKLSYPETAQEGSAPAEPSPVPNLDGPLPELENFVRNARITAVRLSGTSPKIVMNNRVYRLNDDILDLQISLSIVDIQQNQVVFQDEHGFRYTKRF